MDPQQPISKPHVPAAIFMGYALLLLSGFAAMAFGIYSLALILILSPLIVTLFTKSKLAEKSRLRLILALAASAVIIGYTALLIDWTFNTYPVNPRAFDRVLQPVSY